MTLKTMSSNSSSNSRKVVVGYALNPKKLRKSDTSITTPSSVITIIPTSLESLSSPSTSTIWKGGGLADILVNNSNDDDDVEFIPFDTELEPSQHPKYDVIIHKLTEDILSHSDKIISLERYFVANPNCVIIDPIDHVRKVTTRSKTCQCLEKIYKNNNKKSPINLPRYIFIQPSMTINEIVLLMKEAGLTFPVICKPDIACGTPTSHNMVVVVSPSGFTMVTQPCIVQQYIDHDDNFFKVYVIGNDIMYYKRQSTPNLTNPNSSKLKSIFFDSRCMYPKLKDFMENDNDNGSNSNNYDKIDYNEDNNNREHDLHESDDNSRGIPDSTQITAAANALKEEFNLTLFGFDVIIPNKGHNIGNDDDSNLDNVNDLVIIDVNFFPSYKEVADFPHRLKMFLKSRACI